MQMKILQNATDRLRRYLHAINFRQVLELQLELRPYLQGVPYWTAAAVVGLVAVIYSNAFSGSIALAKLVYATNPYLLFITSPLCFLLATWLVEKFAPTAGGTGVPKVTKALDLDPQTEASEIHRYLNFKVFLVVMASSLLGVLGAGSLGREGPMVHMAACLFYLVGRKFTQFSPYTEHRSWIIAGGAAGVAAAFNAPLAGVVFVLEELAQQHFHQFKSVVISAAIIGGMVSQWLSGKYLYFAFPEIGDVPFSSVPWAILVGLLCGTLAFPFQKLASTDWRSKFNNYFNTRLKFAFFVGVCIAALVVFVDPGTMGGGISNIEELLFEDHRASWTLIVGRFFGTIISHLSGCAGGFLAPSLALGAAIGSKLATIANYPSHNLLVMVGMAAFLSANLRAPFTAWVIVMEMTNRHQAIFPLMVTSLIAHGTLEFLIRLSKKNPQKESA